MELGMGGCILRGASRSARAAVMAGRTALVVCTSSCHGGDDVLFAVAGRRRICGAAPWSSGGQNTLTCSGMVCPGEKPCGHAAMQQGQCRGDRMDPVFNMAETGGSC